MAGFLYTPGPAPYGVMGGFGVDFDGNGGISPLPSVGFFAVGYSEVATTYLPAPIKGDSIQLLAKGEILRNRQGAPLASSARGRELYTLTLTFTNLLDETRDRVEVLLASSVGTLLDYVDQRGNVFRGFILNPEAKLVKQGRESNNVTIEFKGVLVK